MAGFSNDTENDVLDYIFSGTAISYNGGSFYVSLHTADPGETGANEVPGTLAGYARKAHSNWNAASGGSITNDGDITFATITDTTDSATITHVGVWTASSGGTFICGGAVGTSKTIAENDIPKILDEELTVSLN